MPLNTEKALVKVKGWAKNGDATIGGGKNTKRCGSKLN